MDANYHAHWQAELTLVNHVVTRANLTWIKAPRVVT